ncbi:MAG: electron transfer flavoprotein subunit alpha/FixB family protein [Dehalobacterium sp.]
MNEQEISAYQGVWVFIEQVNGEIAPVSWELLGKGRELADDLNVPLSGVLLGYEIRAQAGEIISYGADKIYLMDDPVLEHYRTPPYAHGLVQLAKQYKPEIILLGATSLGRDLAGTVATKLGTGLTADCTVLEIDKETRLLKQTRPAWGGNIMATILCKKHRPQMASVRPRVMSTPTLNPNHRGEIIEVSLGLTEKDVPQEFIGFAPEPGTALYLDKADVIVAFGKGIGSQENFERVKTLSKLIGGSLGASRAAVEAGWLGYEHQVGQTGQTVRPRLYMAFGISGAIQHLVGMQNSDYIVAVNKDPEAPIFRVADYGIVGDLNEVLPLFIKELKNRPGVAKEV